MGSYHYFAEHYQWPPSVVRRESAMEMRALRLYGEAVDYIRERQRAQSG